MSNNKKIEMPFDVLAFWYRSAVEAIERYDPDVAYSPHNEEYARKRKLGYEMAVKTVEILKNVIENIEIIEREEKENE